MSGNIYKVVLDGTYHNKDNKAILWYRTEVDMGGGAFDFGGASALADGIVAQVVPSWLAAKPTGYTLDGIQIYPHNNLFQLLYQLPYYRPVNLPGIQMGAMQGTDGPGLCVNIHFQLEPTLIGPQALTAPKRGYLAMGPIPSAWINDDGKIADALFSPVDPALTDVCAAVSTDVHDYTEAAIFAPIRVSSKVTPTESGLFNTVWGYADVSGANPDRYVSFRRSRRIHG